MQSCIRMAPLGTTLPIDAAQSSRFKAEGLLSKDLFDPHPDEPYFRTPSQFSKCGSAEERKVQNVR